MRKFVLAGLMAALSSMVAAAPASAWAEYCDWDPPVLIQTPSGNSVLVYDTVFTSSLLQVGLPVESYSVARAYDEDGNPVTAVDMAISVPAGLVSQFSLLGVVSTGLNGSGQVLGSSSGSSGSVTHVKFTLYQS